MCAGRLGRRAGRRGLAAGGELPEDRPVPAGLSRQRCACCRRRAFPPGSSGSLPRPTCAATDRRRRLRRARDGVRRGAARAAPARHPVWGFLWRKVAGALAGGLCGRHARWSAWVGGPPRSAREHTLEQHARGRVACSTRSSCGTWWPSSTTGAGQSSGARARTSPPGHRSRVLNTILGRRPGSRGRGSTASRDTRGERRFFACGLSQRALHRAQGDSAASGAKWPEPTTRERCAAFAATRPLALAAWCRVAPLTILAGADAPRPRLRRWVRWARGRRLGTATRCSAARLRGRGAASPRRPSPTRGRPFPAGGSARGGRPRHRVYLGCHELPTTPSSPARLACLFLIAVVLLHRGRTRTGQRVRGGGTTDPFGPRGSATCFARHTIWPESSWSRASPCPCTAGLELGARPRAVAAARLAVPPRPLRGPGLTRPALPRPPPATRSLSPYPAVRGGSATPRAGRRRRNEPADLESLARIVSLKVRTSS